MSGGAGIGGARSRGMSGGGARAMRLACAVLVATCLVSAGCATQGTDDPSFRTPTTGDVSTARTRARVHTELAASYFELGNMAVALEEVKEALKAEADYGPAHNVAGLVYAQLKEDQLAEDSFQTALRINPTDSDAHNNYGMFLCERKQEREAIKHFLAAVRNPLYATPERSWVNAGLCARRTGDAATAQGYFRQALKLRPAQPQALYQMADLAYQRLAELPLVDGDEGMPGHRARPQVERGGLLAGGGCQRVAVRCFGVLVSVEVDFAGQLEQVAGQGAEALVHG